MTTRSLPPAHPTLPPGGCAPDFAAKAGLAAACGAFAVVASIGLLYFDNLYGPLGEHGGWGVLAGVVSASAAALAVGGLIRWVARRSRVLLVVVVVCLCAAGWVLLPRQVDVSESWVPRPNARWSCTGWSFQHYPPGTFDASATTYCVGLESRIADG